ncbi:MAG: hypothetical protein QHH09_01520, partial [Microgenomates group bacterium]|nr:hypothetical protein [Microgenomates group bacterium]
MSDPPPGRIDDNTAEIQEAKAEVGESIKNAMNNQEKLNTLAQEIIQEISRLESQASEVKGQVLVNRGNVPEEKKSEAKAVKKALVKVITAVEKQVIQPPVTSAKLFTSIQQHQIVDKITDSTAAFLYPLINKAVSQSITLDDLKESYQLLKESGMAVYNSTLFDAWVETLRKTAEDLGMDKKNAEEKFTLSRQEKEKLSRGAEQEQYDPFLQAWRQYYERYFDSKDKEIVEVIYHPEKFKTLIEKYKTEIRNSQGISDEEKLNELVSERIEREIVLVFGKIYTNLDRKLPDQFFHEIVQQDYWKGIQPTTNEFVFALEKMARYFEQHPEEAETIRLLRRFDLGKKAEEVEVEIEDEEGKKTKVKKTKYRLQPLTSPLPVSVDQYIRYIGVVLNHYLNSREYTHNVRAMFLRPAGKEGYYADLRHYSDKMTTTDLQEMLLLPDSDIFLEALWLYEKFVEAELAKWDWINQPDTFSPIQGDIYNRIEREVFEALSKMYPDDPKLFPDKETRLRGALSMAVGAARGIFLTEPEKVAYADPQLDEKGKHTFRGYYTKDSAALLALNPLHHPLRWQTEGTMSPILFMPIDEISLTWDHDTLWKKMKAFQNSFLAGRSNIGKGRLLIDFLVNIGRIGGFFQRGGWRILPTYEGYYRYKDQKKQELDYVETWKEIEYLGYEINKDFIDRRLLGEEESVYIMRASKEQRESFFRYLYEKFFFVSKQSYEEYMAEVKRI